MEYSHSRGVFEELFAGFEGTIYLLSRGGEVGVEDEDEDDEEEESPGRKERKRAKVHPIFFLTKYVELHFIVIIAPP